MESAPNGALYLRRSLRVAASGGAAEATGERAGERSAVRGVIVRLKIVAVLESGDATLALKSCSHPPIVRERPGA